jgi:hypothetical protein
LPPPWRVALDKWWGIHAHLCSHSRAGALNGRHKTPPDIEDAEPANIPLYLQLQRVIQKEVGCQRIGAKPTRRIGEGPTAP